MVMRREAGRIIDGASGGEVTIVRMRGVDVGSRRLGSAHLMTGACVGGEILGQLRSHDYRKASSTLRTSSGLCLESCENPGASPEAAATGCSQDGMACIALGLLGPDLHVGEGSSMPAGLCFPACMDDAWCAKVWPDGGFCNAASDVSGVCEP